LDKKVENEVLYRLTMRCEEGKSQRQNYLNMAKRTYSDKQRYNMYLKKAEDVDLNYCDALSRDRATIQKYEAR